MIGTLLQQQYRMLKQGERNSSQPSGNKHKNQSSDSQMQQEINQQYVDNYSNEYQEMNIKNFSHSRDQVLDGEDLVSVFYQLVTLVNKHSQLVNNNDVPPISANNQSLLSQNIGYNRLINKKKTTRSPRANDLLKPAKDTEKQKNSTKRQTNNNHKQSYSHSQISKKNISNISETSNKNSIEQVNHELTIRKKSIFKNYSQIMDYHIHQSDDDPQPSPNVQSSHKIKIRNNQLSVSQYSFAHSSKNMEQKQRRKLSIQRSVQLAVKPQEPNLQIRRQFQIIQNNKDLTIINYTSQEENSQLADLQRAED